MQSGHYSSTRSPKKVKGQSVPIRLQTAEEIIRGMNYVFDYVRNEFIILTF